MFSYRICLLPVVCCNRRILRHTRTVTCVKCSSIWHYQHLTEGSQITLNQLNELNWLCPNCINDTLPFNHIVDYEDFYEAISGFWLSNRLPFTQINHLVFNVFELNEDVNVPIFDSDSDLQYFNECTYVDNSLKCDYYLEGSFIKMCSKHKVEHTNLSMIHFNARSLQKKKKT